MLSEAELETKLTGNGAPYALWPDGALAGTYRFGPRTLPELFEKAAKRGEKCFVVTPAQEYSFAEIFERATRFALVLCRNYEIRPGDRVGIALGNSIEWVVAFFAVIRSGATAVLFTQRDLMVARQMLACADCSLLVGSALQIEHLREAGHLGPFIQDMEIRLLTPSAPADEQSPFPSVAPESPSIISFTSGSTGIPKAVVASHTGIVSGLMNMMLSASLAGHGNERRPQGANLPACTLILSPLSYGGGYGQILLAAMLGSRFAVMESGAGAPQIARFIQAIGATSVAGIDNETAAGLLNEPAMLGSLRSWFVSGMALRGSFVRKLEAVLPDVSIGTGYGLTETNGTICSISGANIGKRPGSSGRVVRAAEVKILAPDGSPQPEGVAGSVWLRGPMLMLGYRKADGSLSGLSDGWFQTGDLGHLDAQGHLHILEREDALRGAQGLSATLLEDRLAGLAGVKDVCAVPAELGGQRGIFVLIVPENPEDGAALALRAGSEIPDGAGAVVFSCERLPRTATGKVDRTAVARLGQARIGQRQATVEAVA